MVCFFGYIIVLSLGTHHSDSWLVSQNQQICAFFRPEIFVEMWFRVFFAVELLVGVVADDLTFVTPIGQRSELNAVHRITPLTPEVNSALPKQAIWVWNSVFFVFFFLVVYPMLLVVVGDFMTRVNLCDQHSSASH